jgi:catechol 2,3-dioxygenase-like lactoylglutathione lyase family enzyme
LQFQGSWLLLVTGGVPTENPRTVSHSMTIRVPDCHEDYRILRSRGAEFLTRPYDWGSEIRCFFRDPDGHLLEISQAL